MNPAIVRRSHLSTCKLYAMGLAVTAAIGCGPSAMSEPGDDSAETTDTTQPLFVWSNKVWQKTTISVCWHDSGWATEKEWVRRAINRSWEAESDVEFVGWGPCYSQADIMIAIIDTRPHVARAGSDLQGYNSGMVLNFACSAWGSSICGSSSGNRKLGIEAIGVHEFGHALGFDHEQNRWDNPNPGSWPRDNDGWEYGDTTVGPYDGNSVMNYFNLNGLYANNGWLTAADIEGVRRFYGAHRPISGGVPAAWTLHVGYRQPDGQVGMGSCSWIYCASQIGGGYLGSTPGVAVKTDGSRVDFVAPGGDKTPWANAVVGGSYTGWQPIGSPPAPQAPIPVGIMGQPVALPGANGVVDVFVRRTDNRVFHRQFNGSSWGAWHGANGTGQGIGAFGDLAVIPKGNGMFHVFVRSYDDAIWWSTLTSASSWTNWQSLGGVVRGSPSATAISNGGMVVVARGTDDNTYYREYSGSWSPWRWIPNGAIYGSPTVISRATNKMEVFARGQDNALWMNSRDVGVDSWTGYTQLRPDPFLASPAVFVQPANVSPIIAVRGTDNGIWWKDIGSTYINIPGTWMN